METDEQEIQFSLPRTSLAVTRIGTVVFIAATLAIMVGVFAALL